MRRGLTIVVSAADTHRLRSALGIAAAEAALGGTVRLFFDGDAVPLLTDGGATDLLATAVELGARLILCQAGLADHGIDLQTIGMAAEAGGLVSLLATLGDDRLLIC